MTAKSFVAMPVLVMASFAFMTGSASAQSSYKWTINYPSNASTIYAGSSVTCNGTLVITPANGTVPNAVMVTIKNATNGGVISTGTGGLQGPNGAPGNYTFQVSVQVNSNTPTGGGSCMVQGSTNGGTQWNAGATSTQPTIAAEPQG